MTQPIHISSTDTTIVCHSLGEGTPLLGIHGIISDRSFFADFEAYIPEDFQWITYDRRGYGDSPAPNSGDYSLEAQAEDAAAVLRHMTSTPAWILGHSAGGLVALTLAIRYPELVRGITLIETPVCYNDELAKAIDDWFAKLTQYRDQGKIKKALPLFSRQIGGTAPGTGFDMEKIQKTYRNLEIFLTGELEYLHREVIPWEELCAVVGGRLEPEWTASPVPAGTIPGGRPEPRWTIPCRVMVTEHGKGSIFGRSVQDTAARLGWPVSEIPGFHNVVQEDAKGFAEVFFREMF